MRKSLVVMLALAAALPVLAQTKMGVVDSRKVIMTSSRGKQVTSALEKFSNEKEKQVTALRQELENLQKDLNSPALSNETKEKKAIELDSKRKNLERTMQDARQEWERMQIKELGKIREEVMPIIEEYGKNNGFDMIFDLQNSGIAFMKPAMDVTDEIIKIYDSRQK